ncbi:hypothetical protein M0P65_03250 [Candidatus Gracilibacteria bacterium]|nr:hypothetical protein [Candidatus Gracilibacteria bacterium]
MNYLLYPEAIEKIEKSAVAPKIKKYEKPSIGYVHPSEIGEFFEGLNKLRTLESLNIISRIETILEDKESYKWRIGKGTNLQLPLFEGVKTYGTYEKEIKNDCSMEDIMLMTGNSVFEILTQNQIKNYKKYGFDSLIEFLMTVEAYVENKRYIDYKDEKAYKWERNGIRTSISGCIHGDFRLYQGDIKPYQTLSPFGNLVDFRPESYNTVACSYNVEVLFLGVILKYAEQVKHKLNLKEILEFSESFGSSLGNFGEFGGGDFHDKSSLNFAFLYKIQNPTSKAIFGHNIWAAHNEKSFYDFVIENNDLVIRYDNKNIGISFSKKDIDDLIKAIIVQCANGLGRTSKERIINVLKYRFSEEFKADLIELDEMKSSKNITNK